MFQLVIFRSNGGVTHWPETFSTAEDADFTASRLNDCTTWSVVRLS